MEFIINPDIAYLLLVVGFLIATLALISPGSGFMEAGAIVLLVFAGWIISQLNFNWVAILILILGVFPFLLALRKTQRILFLVISTIALSIGSTFLFVDEAWHPIVDPILAILVNSLVVGFYWIVIRKSLDAIESKPAHNPDTLVGKLGETRTEVYREGSVYVDGEMWTAYSKSPIPSFQKVRIVRREGLSLEVEKIIPENDPSQAEI